MRCATTPVCFWGGGKFGSWLSTAAQTKKRKKKKEERRKKQGVPVSKNNAGQRNDSVAALHESCPLSACQPVVEKAQHEPQSPCWRMSGLHSSCSCPANKSEEQQRAAKVSARRQFIALVCVCVCACVCRCVCACVCRCVCVCGWVGVLGELKNHTRAHAHTLKAYLLRGHHKKLEWWCWCPGLPQPASNRTCQCGLGLCQQVEPVMCGQCCPGQQ